MALRCSIRCLSRGSSPVAFARTDHSGRPIPRRHSLTLCPTSLRLASHDARLGYVKTGCVCLHALSSFQRTDRRCVEDAPPWLASRFFLGSLGTRVAGSLIPPFGTCPKGLAAWPVAANLGEPSKVTSRNYQCQPSFSVGLTDIQTADLGGNGASGKNRLTN